MDEFFASTDDMYC